MKGVVFILAENKNKVVEYDENAIEVLEGLDAVRKRPGMYIGGTGHSALHHMVYEIVDNSVDEALGKYADEINVVIHKDNSLSVQDNGRGIPVGLNEKLQKSSLEVVMTVLHSGGKFGAGGYKVSGGLHGVGLSVVNALSSWLVAEVQRDGYLYQIKMKDQKAVAPLKKVKKTKGTGTKIHFKPDPSIFSVTIFDYDVLATRFKQTAYLTKGLKITLTDLRAEEPVEEVFEFSGGIADLVEDINKDKELLHKKVFYFSGEKDGVEVECAFQYTNDFNDNTSSFVNNIRTYEGGTHEQGFKGALTRVVNDVARKKKVLKDKDKNIAGDDVRDGLTAILTIKMADPQFEGQTKAKLSNSEIKGIVESIANEQLSEILMANHAVVGLVVKRAQQSEKAREAIKKSKEVTKGKSTIDIAGLSGKFAKATSKNPVECELYIVEGDSAGGSAKQGRDRFFQAILPLRGKVINVEKAKISRVLSNEEIKTMINAIGAGMLKDIDITQAKYHKIIIMTDADVDGEHINTLLLTFFFRYLRPIIEAGYLYLAQPPLYKIEVGKDGKGKKEVYYAYSDNERDSITSTLKGKKYDIQRYKGLGEMNADQLWETTMNPATRSLLRVTIEDAIYADKVFDKLMGDKVEPRREFIEQNAQYANIDYGSGG